MSLAERQRCQPSKLARPSLRDGARFDSGTAGAAVVDDTLKFAFGDGLVARCLALNQEMKVRFLLPEPREEITAGQLLLVCDAWL